MVVHCAVEDDVAEMSELGGYLSYLIKFKGLKTQRALAEKAGMDVTYLNKIMKGKIQNPEAATLVRLAEALEVDPLDLSSFTDTIIPESMRQELGFEPREENQHSVVTPEMLSLADIGRQVVALVNERQNITRGPQVRVNVPRSVPIVNGLSASQLADGVRQVAEWIEVSPSQLNGAKDPVAYIINGDCLWERWGIKTGDTLIVDAANTEPRDGQIVAARINDTEETAKEFHRVPDGIDLRPTSKGYKTIEVRHPDQLVIIGVYVTHLVTGKR